MLQLLTWSLVILWVEWPHFHLLPGDLESPNYPLGTLILAQRVRGAFLVPLLGEDF